MIDSQVIEGRIEKFLGYGNLKSNIWFIGMEEGFDGSDEDLEKRFLLTRKKSFRYTRNRCWRP